MGCKHSLNRTKEPWDNIISRTMVIDGEKRLVAVLTCWNCGEQLPLGPAAPDTEQVRIERRAAELAAMSNTALAQAFKLPRNWDHFLGWRYYDCDDLEPNRSELAGYLARAIATHDEGSE